MDEIKVVLIDDHTLFREGLESLLMLRNIEVIASLRDGKEAAELVRQLQPSVVLLDVRMPEMDGISLLRELVDQSVSVPVIILTTSRDEKDLADAMLGGARGYFLKDMEPNELVAALRRVVAGSTEVAAEMRSKYLLLANQGIKDSDSLDSLTPRERETFHLLAEGQSNKLIAKKLGISDGTVKLHVKSILRKLGMRSRVEAAIFAVKRERQHAVRKGH